MIDIYLQFLQGEGSIVIDLVQSHIMVNKEFLSMLILWKQVNSKIFDEKTWQGGGGVGMGREKQVFTCAY